MKVNSIIEHLENAKEIADFINPFVESGKSLVSHTVDELARIEGLEKLIVNFSVRISELETALDIQRNKTESAFAAGLRHAYKKKASKK